MQINRMFSQNLCSNSYADLYISYLQFLIGHLIDNYHFEKNQFNQWWSTIPPTSTKRTTTCNLKLQVTYVNVYLVIHLCKKFTVVNLSQVVVGI